MNRRAALGGSLAGLFLASGLSSADGQEGGIEGTPNLDGKYTAILLKSKSLGQAYLEKVHLTQFAGQPFLVGQGIKMEDPAYRGYEGLVHWIAVDDISMMQVFPNLESIQDRGPSAIRL